MPMVRQLLITLRTLMEDDPQPPKNRRRRPSTSGRSNRNRQTTALVLTFRDLFRSGGLNIILDEIDTSRRPSRKNTRTFSCSSNSTTPQMALCVTNQSPRVLDTRVTLGNHNVPALTSPKFPCQQDETVPLLLEDSPSVPCTDIVPRPMSVYHSSGLFRSLAVLARRKQKKAENLTVPLNPDDENKTVETLKKVLKWSPRKQNSATFAVSLPPTEEKHTAIAVVENAVNRVREEQMTRKKKKKFLWLKFC